MQHHDGFGQRGDLLRHLIHELRLFPLVSLERSNPLDVRFGFTDRVRSRQRGRRLLLRPAQQLARHIENRGYELDDLEPGDRHGQLTVRA